MVVPLLSSSRHTRPPSHFVLASKGFGSPSSSSNSNNKKPPSPKQIEKQLKQLYGGTTPESIAQGTQALIEKRISAQSPAIQQAIQVYRQLQPYKVRLSQVDVDDDALPPDQMAEVQRLQEELDTLLSQEDDPKWTTDLDVQRFLQQATWDASAPAKAARARLGEMNVDMKRKVQKGCDALWANLSSDKKATTTTILDVGCGYGVLVPFLKQAGFAATSSKQQQPQIHGVDLSPVMIQQAQDMYPEIIWEVADFLEYTPTQRTTTFGGLIMCASLHDLPNQEAALAKAHSLLEPQGVLVVMHPQGAGHVATQMRVNPALVSQGLPTAHQWKNDMSSSWEVLQAPAMAKSREELRDGYLAVLRKVE